MSNTFVYVANTESRELLVFRMDGSTGALVLVEHVLGGKFNGIAIAPDKRFLFAALRDEPCGVASFAIDPTSGTLRPIGEARLPGPLAYLSVDRTGRWLFGASYHENFVSVSAIEPNGAVRDPQQFIRSIPKAHAVIASPDNRFVFATSLGTDALLRWPFTASSGELAIQEVRETRFPAGCGPRHFRFHPNGRSLVLLNELDASLRVLDYDATSGETRERAAATLLPQGFKGKPWAADVHVAGEGRFGYASERTSSTLASFRLDDSGRLQILGHTLTERQPRGLAVDPSGRFLLAVGQKSNRLTSYAIDANSGALHKLGEYPVGADPMWIEIITL